MSKKSKHHKPKGPKNPPQTKETPAQAGIVQETQEPKPDVSPPVVEVKPEIQAKKDVKEVVKQEVLPEAKLDQPPAEPSGSDDAPSKPKRNRNRNKKNKKQSDEPDQGEEEVVPEVVPEKKAEKLTVEMKVESPIVERTVEEVKEEPKPKDAPQNDQKKNKKNEKKGKGQAQEKKEESKVIEEMHVSETPKDAPKCEIAEKKVDPAKIAEEVKTPDIKPEDVQTSESREETAGDSKNQKNKKSKNKQKNKETQSVETAKETVVEVPKIEKEITKSEAKPEPVIPANEPVPDAKAQEQPKAEADKAKIENEQHPSKGDKKNKKGKKAGQRDEEKTQKPETAKNSEETKVDAVPECAAREILSPAAICSAITDAKPTTENKPEENLDDDILPSLASSIEKTLEQLIVCESDIVLGEQLKLEEDNKKKAEKEKHEKKHKKGDKKAPQNPVVPKQVADDSQKEIIAPPVESIELKIQEAINDTITKIEDTKPEGGVNKPEVQPVAEAPKEKHQELIVVTCEIKKDAVEHLKVEEKGASSKSPTRKEKRKKSPRPQKHDEIRIDMPGVPDTPIVQPESKDKVKDVICETIPEAKPLPEKIEDVVKSLCEPVPICAVSDDIINQLLSDETPDFVKDTSIAKSVTILDDMPKCELKKAEEQKPAVKPEPRDPMCDFKLSESLLNVCQIESNIEKEMKKALEVALGVIVSDIPPIQIKDEPIIEAKQEEKTVSEIVAEKVITSSPTVIQEEVSPTSEKFEEAKGANKKKQKKHDKHKPDVAEEPPKEEVPESKTIIEEIVVEPKPVEEETKQTDSPKPTKRNKDKKGKSGKGSGEQAKNASGEQSQSQQSAQKSEGDKSQKESEKSADDKKQKDSSGSQDTKTEQKDQDNSKSQDADNLNASEKRSDAPASSSETPVAKQGEGKFEFMTIPDSALKCTVDESKKEKDKNKRKSPPKNQPKNLLGRSNTPVKSSKYDYKKEKNKDPEAVEGEMAKVEMRNLDPQDMPELIQDENVQKSGLPQCPIPATNRENFEKTRIMEYDVKTANDDDEEFVYKYSFRTVFIANACHVCKVPLKDERIVCRFCHLVGYCDEKHRDDDWTLHQSLCYAVSTLSNAKGQSHIYEDAKSLNGQDYRLLRMQAIVSCEKILKRKLCPWEQEALLYPRMCSQPSCREWKTPLLKDCTGCGQISYCASDQSHLLADHANWCQSYRLYYKLVNHQLNHGRLEPQLPNKIPPTGYLLPDKSSVLFDDLYGNVANFDDCHFATLTQLSTVPLTTLYAYQKATEKKKHSETIPNGIIDTGDKKNAKTNFCIHLIGAELQFEGDTLKKWECFFLHLMPEIREILVVFIGPELNVAKLPVELLARIKLCEYCQQTGRKIRFDFVDDMLYHDYVETEKFTRPDIICAFNPGFHRATGYAGLDTWPETIAAALRLHVPLCVSAYTAHEMPRDLERVRRCAPNKSVGPQLLVPPGPNPYTSLRPDRNFVSDDEMPLIFKNYHTMVVSG